MQDKARPFIADDPGFVADLGSLDEGLDAATPPARTKKPRPAISAPPAVLESPSSELPPIQITPVGRPLIDLFPSEALQPPTSPDDAPSAPATRPPTHTAAPRATAQDYERFYGLVENPFTLSTDPKFIFHSAAHDRSAQELLTAIRRRDAIVVITGEPGIGKTTMCRAVMEELDRRTITSFVADPTLSPDDLLKRVLVDFGVITRDDLAAGRLASASRASLMGAAREFLRSLATLQAFAVIIVDEAHTMALELFEQLRLLSDLQDDPRLLQIVFVGEPALSAQLRRAELRTLAARVGARCALGPLEPEEVGGYIAHRLQTAADRPRVTFTAGAAEALFTYSRGTPRIINLVADRALALGCERAVTAVDSSLVEQAAADRFIEAPRPPRWTGRFVAAIVFALLVLAGAGSAAWVFRAPLARLVARWAYAPAPQSVPASPPAPRPHQ